MKEGPTYVHLSASGYILAAVCMTLRNTIGSCFGSWTSCIKVSNTKRDKVSF